MVRENKLGMGFTGRSDDRKKLFSPETAESFLRKHFFLPSELVRLLYVWEEKLGGCQHNAQASVKKLLSLEVNRKAFEGSSFL